MKTENPYLDAAFTSSKKTNFYHEIWQEGYAAATRDTKPKVKELEWVEVSQSARSERQGLDWEAYDGIKSYLICYDTDKRRLGWYFSAFGESLSYQTLELAKQAFHIQYTKAVLALLEL